MTDRPKQTSPIPPKGCSCASFWTVRRRHKRDCKVFVDELMQVVRGPAEEDVNPNPSDLTSQEKMVSTDNPIGER
jgi:hypothetical protein